MTRTKRRGAPTLKERIASFMEALNLNASELSARTGISVSYLTRIIQGEVVNPTIDFVIRIADGLGVTESELLRPEKNSSKRGAKGVAQAKTAGRKDKQNQRTVGYGRGMKTGTQANSTPLHSTAHSGTIHSAMTLPDSLLYITFNQIETRIKSRDLSEEQMKRMAAGLLDSTDLLLEAIKPQYEE